jgi:hypothetical protein
MNLSVGILLLTKGYTSEAASIPWPVGAEGQGLDHSEGLSSATVFLGISDSGDGPALLLSCLLCSVLCSLFFAGMDP